MVLLQPLGPSEYVTTEFDCHPDHVIENSALFIPEREREGMQVFIT